jgi:uncharacterized protein
VSRRRYLVRRLFVAGGALGVLVVVIAALSAASGGGSADVVAPGDTSIRSSVPSPGPEPEPEPVEETDAGDPGGESGDGGTVSGGSFVPTPATPARVYIAGDSDAGTFGPYLEQLLGLTGVTTSTLDYKVSSGLTRPDFYDWPARLREQMPIVDPHIVVVTFGGNDAQDIRVDGTSFGVSAPEWTTEYRRRVGEVLDTLGAGGRKVIWVGIPNASSESFTNRLRVQRDAVVAELAERPDVAYVDAWERFSGRNGGYAEYVIDPRDGVGKDVRASDGFHLNTTGAEILALDIAEVVREVLRGQGAAI